MKLLRLAPFAVLAAAPLQAQLQLQARPTPGPARHLGTYHVSTGTWTRGGPSASISPDAIYRNDAPSGYFGSGWEGCWSIDEAMLPGTDNPYAGTQDAYALDGFDFSYCKNGAGTVDWTFGHFTSYVPCDDPTQPAGCIQESLVGFQLLGLPGGNACWTVTLDLSGGYEVCFPADGGICAPGYQGNGLDHAGLGFGWITADGGSAGPVLGGDPSWMPRGEGTCYLPAFTSTCGAPTATGLGARDLFSLGAYDFGGTGTFTGCPFGSYNCAFFGGYANGNGCGAPSNVPLAQFAFSLYADCTTAVFCEDPPGFCDESQNPNNTADIAIDTADSSAPSIHVSLSSGPPSQFCYLLVGNGNQVVSQPPGSKGDLCVAGGTCLGRFDKDIGPISAGGTFDTDIQNALSTPCQGAFQVTPGSTWTFQYWHRQPMGQPSTFSSAIHVTFQ